MHWHPALGVFSRRPTTLKGARRLINRSAPRDARPLRRYLLPAFAMSAAFAGAAPASYAAGLTNPGFEAGLSDWTPTRLAYNPETEAFGEPVPAVCARPEGICAVTTDTFQVTETDEQGNETTRDVTVQPLEGTQMARIGGPFTSSEQTQSQDRYRLEQRFTVDPAAPALALNYNVFTFDYQGFDEVRFTVSLADAEGDVILAQEQGAFGPSGDTSLKTTGWTSAGIDLTGYEGQELRLRIELAGTKDQLYGFWAYIDAGLAPEPPVGRPGWSGPATTPSGEAVDVDVECNPQTDECWILIPTSQAAEFEGGCLGPITLNIPLNPGTGTVSDFELILETGGPAGTERFAGSDSDNNNVWAVEIPCFQEGDLWLSYRLTEGGESQTFLIPYGGLVLIDPAGIVHDKARYDAAIASGQTREQALASSAIEAATVRLQRLVDETWRNVLS